MTINRVIGLLYELSDEYIAENYDYSSNDIGYNLGLKHGIEGFRRAMLYHLTTYEQDEKKEG